MGRLGPVSFDAGIYIYVGSALSGLGRRLERHLRRDGKKRHWHVDSLLERAEIEGILFAETPERVECTISQEIAADSSRFRPVPGFGNSDCTSCIAHLYWVNVTEDGMLRDSLIAILKENGLAPEWFEQQTNQ